MRRLIAVGLCVAVLAVGARAFAEEAADATYIGGTVPEMREGATGKLDTTVAKELRFNAGAAGLAVPYERMTRVEYREVNRFKLGVVGTIVVGIVKAREKVRTVTITWKDDKDTPNVATLEMSREKASALLDVLRARAHVMPSVCEAKFNETCAKEEK
jgi:hypothetical protein